MSISTSSHSSSELTHSFKVIGSDHRNNISLFPSTPSLLIINLKILLYMEKERKIMGDLFGLPSNVV